MSDENRRDGVYKLKGPDLEVTYRPKDAKLDIDGDDRFMVMNGGDPVVEEDPVTGLRITQTLLQSDRSGRGRHLLLLLPATDPERGKNGPEEITGVAVAMKTLAGAVGRETAALQSFGDVQLLEGTFSAR